MHRLKLRLGVAALTFVIGASADSHLRHEINNIPDCYCATPRCRVLSVADHPLEALKHPSETIELLVTARWLD